MDHMTKVMENAGREAHADRILRLDKIQSSPQGVVCPINPEHGRMGVHRDGEMLLCTYPIKRDSQSIKMCNGHAVVGASE